MAAQQNSDVILWKRWTDGETWPGAFYRACAIFPLDGFYEPDLDQPSLKIIDGPLRLSFRHVPIVTLGLLILLTISSPSFFSSIGEPQLLSEFHLLLTGVFVISMWVAVLFWLIFKVRIVEDARHLLWLILTSFTISLLIAGSALAISLSYTTEPGEYVGPRLIYDSGALLFFVLFGLLAYDTILRTENFISNFHTSDSVLDATSYDEYLIQLEDDLTYKIHHFPASYIFGIVIQIPYVPFLYGRAELSLINVTYIIINFHLLVFLFQFFIISKFLVKLAREGQYGGNGWHLLYRPFHPDRRAGFRDFGRFGLHMSVILILVGLMFLYFLHVQGRFSMIPNEIGLAWAMWVTAFIVPILLYTIVFHLFAYYYFGAMHKYMVEMRYDLVSDIEKRLRNKCKPQGVTYDPELLSEIIKAPTWPLGVWKLRLLYVVSSIPAFLAIPMLIGWEQFFDLMGNLPFI